MMTRNWVSLLIVIALALSAATGCQSKDKGQTGTEDMGEVIGKKVDPDSIPKDMLDKLLEGAPDKMSTKIYCTVFKLSKDAYMCCSWTGHMSCQPCPNCK